MIATAWQHAHMVSGMGSSDRTTPADELVDIIDASGQTIATVTRREMRQRRLPHRCTYIFLFNSRGELFIHQQTSTKDVYPGYWDLAIGGVLAAGEIFDQGACREAREELGVDVALESVCPFRYEDAATIVHAMIYRGRNDGPFRLQPEEIVRGEFVPPGEALTRTRETPFCPDGLAAWQAYNTFNR